MIRDEFLKDKYKKMSAKNMKKMRDMGERAFYSSEISLLRSTLKTFDVTFILIGLMTLVFTVLLVNILIVQKGFGEGVRYVIGAAIDAVLLIAIAIWFLFGRFKTKNKITKYQEELKKLNEKEMAKQQAIYNKMIKK